MVMRHLQLFLFVIHPNKGSIWSFWVDVAFNGWVWVSVTFNGLVWVVVDGCEWVQC